MVIFGVNFCHNSYKFVIFILQHPVTCILSVLILHVYKTSLLILNFYLWLSMYYFQSLVGKLKRNVTEIISNTPLSKWFHKQREDTPAVRRRQEDSDDEDLQEFQPPAKRTKLPSTKEALSLNVSEILSPISSNNSRKPLPNRNFPEPIAGPSGYQTRKILNSTSLFTDTNRSSKFAGDVKTIFHVVDFNIFAKFSVLLLLLCYYFLWYRYEKQH